MEKILENLSKIKVSDLERKGTDFPFSDVQHINKFVFEKVKILKENLDFVKQLPEDKKTEMINAFESFYQLVTQILTFNPSQENPQHQRDEIARGILRSYDTFFERIFPYLDIFILAKRSSETELEKLISQVESQAKEFLSGIENQSKNANKITDALKKVSAEAGVSKFTEVFSNQAEQNRKTASNWLLVSVGTTIALFVILFWTFGQLNIPKEGIDSSSPKMFDLQAFLARALIFSFAVGVFWQIVKNYHANMHLYTLNKHRQNMMTTFQAFVESTEDPKVRDAVLIQTTRAIFEAGETGFVSSRGNSSITGLETIKIAEQARE